MSHENDLFDVQYSNEEAKKSIGRKTTEAVFGGLLTATVVLPLTNVAKAGLFFAEALVKTSVCPGYNSTNPPSDTSSFNSSATFEENFCETNTAWLLAAAGLCAASYTGAYVAPKVISFLGDCFGSIKDKYDNYSNKQYRAIGNSVITS